MNLKSIPVKVSVVAVACSVTVVTSSFNVELVETALKLALAASYGALARSCSSHCKLTEEWAARMLSVVYLLFAMLGSLALSESYIPGFSEAIRQVAISVALELESHMHVSILKF